MGIPRDKLNAKALAAVEAAERKQAAPYISKQAGPKGKRTKFGNTRTHCDIIGRTFDSKWERTVARRLYARQQAGEISDLTFQVTVDLLGCVRMRPDFQYREDGELITHEAKGSRRMETPKYVLQRKLWAIAGPTRYRIAYQVGSDVDMTPRPTDEMVLLVLETLRCDYLGSFTLDELYQSVAEDQRPMTPAAYDVEKEIER